MDRRRIIRQSLLGMGLVVLVLLLIWILTGNRQPRREGRTVTQWSMDLLSPEPSTRSNAALVMKSFGPETVPILARQLKRRDSWLRDPFLSVSSQLPMGLRRAFVRSFQPFRAREERLAAATALALHGTNVPVDLLLKVLRDPDRQLAGQAAAALGGCGAQAVPGLTIALRESDPEVRRLACYAISQIGPSAHPTAPDLAVLLSDPDPQMMGMAAHALTMIGVASIPHLILALDNPQPRVRARAAAGLARFRSAATNAIPALELLLDDENPQVRRSAEVALYAITSRRLIEFGTRHPSRDF